MVKHYSKDFIILIIGQIISIIGNSLVGFFLSLFILDVTGSASTFAIICAVSGIPWAIAGPLGGILCDKVSKKKIMVCLDFMTASLLLGLALIGFTNKIVLTVTVSKILLETIKAMYSPCVSSSTSFLVSESCLLRANALVSQINSIASILSPLLAGILYSFLDVKSILMIVAFMYFVSAILECFMKIPSVSRVHKENSHKTYSLRESIIFLRSENRDFFMYLIVKSFSVGLCVSAMINIGLPYVINIYLALSSKHYGIVSAIASLGSLFAGLIIYKLNNKEGFKKIAYTFVLQGAFICLWGISMLLFNGNVVFVLICISLLFMTIARSSMNILTSFHIQKITPPKMLGKIMSIVPIIDGFTEPGGQILYGILFDIESFSPEFIIITSGIIILFMSSLAYKFSKNT